MKNLNFLFLLCLSIGLSCSSTQDIMETAVENPTKNYKILALGDSYTIGESVCNTCRFPEQLKDTLSGKMANASQIDVKIIAKTGWTTTNLINAIEEESPSRDYDLVTLLIGVNNQYQNKPFSMYEEEFPALVDKAILFGKGDKSNLIVISIPDYAFTPYGQNSSNSVQISTEIDQYNTFAKNYCEANNITFINITDITKQGLNNPELVASDGLHPSKKAYSKFVKRFGAIAFEKIQ